jgi:hypothetical protein
MKAVKLVIFSLMLVSFINVSWAQDVELSQSSARRIVIKQNIDSQAAVGSQAAADSQASVDTQASVNTQASGDSQAAADSEKNIEEKKDAHKTIFPEPDKVKYLDNYYLPLQENPQYYSDRKCKNLVINAYAVDLIKYKPNFGKKIWMKSHDADSLREVRKYLGQKLAQKNFQLSAIEIADHVYPHVKDYLKDTNIDIDSWSDKFEIWGRTYVDPADGGKRRSHFIALDFQNGNFLVVSPRRGQKKCYYISEKFDSIIKAIISYTPLNEK